MPHDTLNPPEANWPEANPSPARSAAGHVRSILVVDNEPLICEVIAAILQGANFSVHTVWSGTEALQVSAARHFDLVLLDVNLPGLSGDQTLAALLNRDPALRVVMMSGLDHSDRALKHGATGFLLKPYRPWQVLSEVEQALREPASASWSENPDSGSRRQTRRSP